MSSPDHFESKTAYLEGTTITDEQATDALAYLVRRDATDLAPALGLAPYTGHARVYRNGSAHAVERGAR